MSRIAKKPLEIPKGVEFSLKDSWVSVKGKNGEFKYQISDAVNLEIQDNIVSISAKKDKHPMVGTTRVLLENMIHGVNVGFEKKLKLIGVGYRAILNGDVLDLSLGFSHPVKYPAPTGIRFEVPSVTEIVIKGMDKQVVGQVAAEIRVIRPPEPYKGKGIRYSDEKVNLKEIKKK